MSTPPPQRRVVLVDDDDNELGEDTVLGSHAGAGKRHRAFTAVVLDGAGRVLLAQRSREKLLWPGHWDATVASHPLLGESYAAAGERRIAEELGATCPLVWCGRFAYDVPYGDVGSENEVCATLVGRLGADQPLRPAPSEVSDLVPWQAAELVADLRRRPERYCPWLFLAFLSIVRHAERLTARLADPLAPLLAPHVPDALRASLTTHFASGEWTLVDATDAQRE